jgi:hypothetical protein
MNKHDQDNLHFLLHADNATLQDWYDKMDHADHVYAAELLHQAQLELSARMDTLAEPAEDLSAANAILSKFRL